MSLRRVVREAVEQGRLDEAAELVRSDPRALRHVVGMTYRTEEGIRVGAAKVVAAAADAHPKLVQETVRRFVWAMNDESGTNALSAPGALLAIAREKADLLLPMVPDLVRLSADPGLREGLSKVLEVVRESCPGEVGARLAADLSTQGES